jgi:holin-like protein
MPDDVGMLEALTTLLLFQLLGESLTYLLGLPLPGPVIGMAALFLAWPWLTRLHAALERLSADLLAHLGLLFVPAGVGVMLHLGLLATWWLPLLAALVISTSATMALSAWLFVRLRRRRGDEA